MKPPRILFSGYYGFGNAGDEAVLAASVAMFRERRPDLPLAALSADPRGTRRALGIEAVGRMGPLALREIRRCSLFLSGGGSLLQDRTSVRSLAYYLLLLDLARRCGARTMIFAQGVGPLVRESSRRWVARALARVDAVTVRDADSAELLHSLGIGGREGPRVEVTADPVFALRPEVTDRVHRVAPGRPAIAVSVRPWPASGKRGRGGGGSDAGGEAERLLGALAEALARFEGEASLQAWPLSRRDDLALCEALAARLPEMTVVQEPLTPGEWMALAGWTDAVVGMRLHALIFAAARGTPALGISYDPKVDALLARLRTRPVGTAEALDPDRLRTALEAALEEEESRRRDREARAEHLRAAAYRNVDRALELLGLSATPAARAAADPPPAAVKR